MSDYYNALGGYEGPIEIAQKKGAQKILSLDADEIKREMLSDQEFMRHRSEMESYIEGKKTEGPVARFGGPDDKDESFRGGETIYKPVVPDEKESEGDFTRGAVIRDFLRRKAKRAFQNKFGRPPTDQEEAMLNEKMMKSLIDWGQDISPTWEKEVGVEPAPRKI